tara:strand:- start:106 stop:696 length:591 start_codon:yes stop_codon:yes gene_type:complete
MIDPTLINYINQQLRNGSDINTIRNTLIQQGWDQNTLDESINSIYNKNTNQNINIKNQKGGNKMVDMKNPHYGGFWIRFVAAILDALIIGIPVSIIGWGLAFATGVASMTYVASLASVVLVVYLDGIKGGTPGKLILGMRIVNEQGNYIGIPMAILRYIGKILSGIILGIGYLMIAFTEKKQGLHDKIAKTYVVKV